MKLGIWQVQNQQKCEKYSAWKYYVTHFVSDNFNKNSIFSSHDIPKPFLNALVTRNTAIWTYESVNKY